MKTIQRSTSLFFSTFLFIGFSGCFPPSECGDGILQLVDDEECDDGNTLDGDGCTANCTIPACGDNIVDKGELCFGAPLSIEVGQEPSLITTGDFNGDFLPDLAITNRASNDISLLFNEGGGAFSEVRIPVGEFPIGIQAIDLNKDNSLDLIVGCGRSNEVFLLFNDGTGTFSTQILDTGDGPFGIAAADFTLDGTIDVSVSNGNDNNVSVFLQDNQKNFTEIFDQNNIPVRFPAGEFPLQMDIGDLDQDNRPDIAIASANTGEVILLLNQESQEQEKLGFSPVVEAIPLGINFFTNVSLGDVNQDDLLDILVYDENSTEISLLLNQGTEQSQAIPNFEIVKVESGEFRRFGILADLDLDEDEDVLVVSDTEFAILPNQGDANFEEILSFPIGSDFFGIAVADFNQDTVPDIALAEQGVNQVTFLISDP